MKDVPGNFAGRIDLLDINADWRACYRDDGPISPARAGQEQFCTGRDRKSTRLNSSHANISYAVFCLKKKTKDAVDGALYRAYPHDHLLSEGLVGAPLRPHPQHLRLPRRALCVFSHELDGARSEPWFR